MTSAEDKGIEVQNASAGGKKLWASHHFGMRMNRIITVQSRRVGKASIELQKVVTANRETQMHIWRVGVALIQFQKLVSANRGPENCQRKQRDSNAYMKSWSSIDTAPESWARCNSHRIHLARIWRRTKKPGMFFFSCSKKIVQIVIFYFLQLLSTVFSV
jgi:hypothetical protein